MSMTDVAVTAKVTSKGQVTIPIDVRRLLDIEAGDSVLFTIDEDERSAVVSKVPNWLDLFGSVPVPEDRKDWTWEQIREHAHRAVAARYLRSS